MKDKVTIKMSLQLKDCDKIFKEGMDPGVVVTQEFVFKDVPEKDEPGFNVFCRSMMDYEDDFLKQNVRVVMEEVENA